METPRRRIIITGSNIKLGASFVLNARALAETRVALEKKAALTFAGLVRDRARFSAAFGVNDETQSSSDRGEEKTEETLFRPRPCD